ncbi:class F sortase [Amycolatopsis sp. CA-230715]|uniref:class F sortase n=1 Tax=Amycolatopsis sp. CA-230715 TaxID=2745196 RepID=UPI001C0124FB|nr:hypothetical protein HUW46_00696 [Amycolatopsis sp. CA-230715]
MDEEADERAPEPLPRWRRWTAAALGALAVAAVITGALVLTMGGGDEPPRTVASPPPPPSEVELPPDNAVIDALPGQRPGTVRLPEGGTATLVRKELTRDRTLPIPKGLDQASWWGAKVGAPTGVSLLSGHVNWAGVKGPFDELWRAKPGQDVTVVDTGGGTWVYRVSEIVTVHKDDLPAQAPKLFDQGGPPRLVLVTCGGDYLGGTEGYRDNRIVTAQLVSHH